MKHLTLIIPPVVVLSVLLGPAAYCGETVQYHSGTMVFAINTTAIDSFVERDGSLIRRIYRVDVSLKEGKKEPEKYEYLVYDGAGKPIGCHRFRKLQTLKNKEVVINLKHKSPSPDQKEAFAAANAVVRIAVDAMLAGGGVTEVKVPASSFDYITEGLTREDFSAMPETMEPVQVPGSVVLYLNCADGIRDRSMYYTPN